MLLSKVTVSPMHSQVDLFAPDGQEDLPEWPEADTLPPVVASPECIYVGTINDLDGLVTIETWLGEYPSQQTKPRYEGVFRVYRAGALVGSWTGNHLALLPLREGTYHIRVFTFPEGTAHPNHVLFVLEELLKERSGNL